MVSEINQYKSKDSSANEEFYDIKSNKEIIVLNETAETDSEEEKDGIAVEKVNPLGNKISPLSVVVLILQGIVGTGIFSTPGSILNSMGSIGSTYVLWICCWFISLFNVFVYIEYAGYYPKRNGGDVAYLEHAYRQPKYLVPTIYAAVSVILSFTTSSALAFGQYILKAAEIEATEWKYKGIALGALTFSALCVAVNTKQSLRLQNILGFIKVVFLLFMIILGWVILGGGTRIKDPHQSFHNVWEGTTTDGNAIASSIVKVTFSYSGYSYAFGVVAEHTKTDGSNPENDKKKLLRTYTTYVPLSIFLIFVAYILIITAYYSSASPDEIKESKNTVAALLFANAFSSKQATKALCAMVALSAFGHLITAILSHSRALRECGRQGVLPFGKFWTSTKPFGTPLGPVFITWLVNTLMIVCPPAGSAYNFIADLGTYSSNIFSLFLVFGLLKVRRNRKLKGLGAKGRLLPLPFLIITLLFQLMVLIMPFVPPSNGTLIGSDVGFFYATYPIVTIGLLGLCTAYYFIWKFAMPKIGKFARREIVYRLENGEIGNKIVQVKLSELEEWDRHHNTNEDGVAISHEISLSSANSTSSGIESVHELDPRFEKDLSESAKA
ncbi:hypothetical protein B5S28_g2345 [[Candida] boidinii]|nr:hypothetical protein B5S28_g2345 [[Candida] boidinii]OWB79239.1 hypothetical protein B5S32_g3453 [[Candida] boidinii]